MLFLARMIDGLTAGNMSTAMAYLADSSRPQERAKLFAFAGVAFGVGFTLGPVISGALANISLAAPAYAAGVLSLLSFLFGFFFLPESLPVEKRSRERLGWRQVNPLAVIAEMTRLPNLGVLLAAYFLLYLAYSGLFTYIAVFAMERFSATPGQNAILLGVVGLMQLVGQGGIVYRLTPRFGEKKIALVGLGLQAIAYPLFIIAPEMGFLFPLGVISALGNSFTRPTLDALVANSVALNEQGRTAGSVSALSSLTNVLGPLLAGLVYQWISPGSVFLAGGALIAVTGILVNQVRNVEIQS